MDRLSAQDAIFLHMEGDRTPYHVASLMLFAGRIDFEELVPEIDARLPLVPRMRQRLAFVPFEQGRPVWVDDEHFDVRYHVRHVVLDRPRTEERLLDLCSELMAQHLDRARPLWELYLVNDLEGGRSAVFGKTHHCMVDGVSGLDVTTVLLDPSATVRRIAPQVAIPISVPSRRRLLEDALIERASLPLAGLRRVISLSRHPRELARSAKKVVLGAGALVAAEAHLAPPSAINVPITPNRRLRVVRTELADFKHVKNTLGGTVNDVALAVVTGALRDLHLHRGLSVDGVELEAMVPVSIRDKDRDGQTGNKVSTIVAPLPIGIADPRERYDYIRGATMRAKASYQIAGTDLMFGLSGIVPSSLLRRIAGYQNVQRVFNTTVTNVPGPSERLFAAGLPMLDLFPFTPLAGNMSLIVALVSYAGCVEFGLTTDPEALPDIEVLSDGITRGLCELTSLAGAAKSA